MARRAATDVAQSRSQTLDAAVALASVVGLEGLTIGRLAEELEMSKSGLVGRFGSKQQLQLAALEQAVGIFRHAVYEPALRQPPGLPRLTAICDAWLDYLRHPPFAGGCFLTTASVEFDARPGALNQAVKRVMRQWMGALEREARVATEAGELPPDTDPNDVAFSLNALAIGANCDFQLRRDPRTLARAKRAMADVLKNSPHNSSAQPGTPTPSP